MHWSNPLSEMSEVAVIKKLDLQVDIFLIASFYVDLMSYLMQSN